MFARDFYGDRLKWFVGIVKEVHDDKSRARVRIFGVHHIEDTSNVSDGDLPWAIITYPVDATSNHSLKLGDWVVGFFSDGDDAQQPVILGMFPGGEYGGSSYNGGPDFSGAGGESSDPVDPNQTQHIPGGSNVEKCYNFIYDTLQKSSASSDPKLHASAMVGNMQLEATPSINPNIVNGIGAHGICQWLGDRRSSLKRRYGPEPTLENQLDFMWWEFNNTESSARKAWLGATNLEDAVAGCCAFERAEEWQKINGRWQVNRNHKNYKIRLKYAYGIYNSNLTFTPSKSSETPSGIMV